MLEELKNFWKAEFRNTVPEAHELKHNFRDRWVRFHSLPDSKRSPEFEEEYAEIFLRQNTIIRDLLDRNSKVIIVLTEYSENHLPIKVESIEPLPTASYWYTYSPIEDNEFKVYWHLHATEIEFSGFELNQLFRLVANDEVGNIMIISVEKSILFHPYDGGIDIILPSTKQRDDVKEKYSEWLSSHPEGF